MQRAGSPSESSGVSAEDLKDRIELFLLELQHPVLSEPGREMMDLSSSNYSLVSEYNKLLWHVWNDRLNYVRQITGIHKERPGKMELRFQKFGKGPPGTLILAETRAGAEQLERRSERAHYAHTLRQFLAQLFPQWKIEVLSTETDLRHSFSGCYARGMLVRGQRAWAVIGAGEHEEPHITDEILTYALIWLDWLRRRHPERVLEGLKIFVPPKRSAATQQRLSWLDLAAARWEIYETGDPIVRRDPMDAGNLRICLAPAGGPSVTTPAFQSWTDRVRSLDSAIEARFITERYGGLAYRGLPFAKETAQGPVFGVGRAETPLREDNFGSLQRLIAGLQRYRCSRSPNRLHPYYRLRSEKWMQSEMVRQIGVLGYDLVPDALYEQVPAVSGTERGLLDLLAVNLQGRLAVVEFKVSEDIHLPLQALDYWMRVREYLQRGEFKRQGYFPQRGLSSQEPLLLLVSPALQFHPACETVIRYFSPSIEVVRVGLNEEWREQLQVLFRTGR